MASFASSIFFLLSLALALHAAQSTGGFSVELFHRDSLYYNPSDSPFDRVRATSHRSISRANYFNAALSSSVMVGTFNDSSFHSEVLPNIFDYLMTVYIGTPPSKILAIADTGSDITWTQCKPCVACYPQNDPLFDPESSSSYRDISCDSQTCNQVPDLFCQDSNSCGYQIVYGDRSHSEGALATDTFWFDSTSGRRVSIPKMVFGCSHDTNGTFDTQGSGLVGLGGGPLSLVSQLGSSIHNKFSYCLVPYSQNASSSPLNFGVNAEVSGDGVVTTPLLPGSPSTFYFLSLEGIEVAGEEKISVTRSSSSGEGNIIIDSGTTLTLLDDDLVEKLENKLSKVITLPPVSPVDSFRLCFDDTSAKGDDLPDITFQFTGAPLKLSSVHTFIKPEDSVTCLAILPNQGLGVSIYGNMAQQNFHIGYDLGAQKLSFAPADCTKL